MPRRADPHTNFAKHLLAWFDQHGRHDLPWQDPRTPYRVWISEIMLQQTQVAAVIPYFERWLQRFPDLPTLANSPAEDVMAMWSGLGYYARARNAHRAAQTCMTKHAGELPGNAIELEALPGIGRSTAAAIVAQAFNQRAVILDGNVKRVLARQFLFEHAVNTATSHQTLWQYAERLTPNDRSADYTQAIMDLGATLCTPKSPACGKCPVRSSCMAHQHLRVDDLPVRRAKVERPVLLKVIGVIEKQNGELLLQQRPNHGIWGGLMSLPEFATTAALREFTQALMGARDARGQAPTRASTRASTRMSTQARASTRATARAQSRAQANDKASAEHPPRLKKLPRIHHVLTHRELDLRPFRVELAANTCAPTATHEGEWRWVQLDKALQLGLPKPIRAIIESLQKTRNKS